MEGAVDIDGASTLCTCRITRIPHLHGAWHQAKEGQFAFAPMSHHKCRDKEPVGSCNDCAPLRGVVQPVCHSRAICDSSLGCYLQSKTRPCCCSSETFYNYFKTYRENLLQMLPKKQNGSKRFNQRWILTQDDNFYKPEQEQKRKDTTSLRNRTVEKDKLTQQTAEQDR